MEEPGLHNFLDLSIKTLNIMVKQESQVSNYKLNIYWQTTEVNTDEKSQ